MVFLISKLRLRTYLKGLCDGVDTNFRLETRGNRVEMIISNANDDVILVFAIDRVAYNVSVTFSLFGESFDLPPVFGWLKRTYPEGITFQKGLNALTILNDVRALLETLSDYLHVENLRSLLSAYEKGGQL